MRQLFALLLFCNIFTGAFAAWYWPFGEEEKEDKPPRMSELMEKASVLIDTAADKAAKNQIEEAIKDYEEALVELEKLERDHPARAATVEFATVRNKKAYVSAAINSLYLGQASANARAVAVTDTSELEKKYAKLKSGAAKSEKSSKEKSEEKPVKKDEKKVPEKVDAEVSQKSAVKNASPSPAVEKKGEKAPLLKVGTDRKSRLMLAAEDLKKKDYAAAMLTIEDLLAETPNDAVALNLKAAVQAAKGEYKLAEDTLHQVIRSNPRKYYGYYNLAKLILQTRGQEGKPDAKRYYDNARQYYGGPVDETLEKLLK